jgi:hypothetical protein
MTGGSLTGDDVTVDGLALGLGLVPPPQPASRSNTRMDHNFSRAGFVVPV